MDTTTINGTNNKLSAIEKALAAAKARKAAAASASPEAPPAEATRATRPSNAPTAKADAAEARAAKKAQIEADRAARAAAKAQKAATPKAPPVRSTPAHMKKVEKAAAKLPRLTPDAELRVSELVAGFPPDQLAAIALHLQHSNRVAATVRSAGAKLEVGMPVRITGGEARFIGREGRVTEVRRIRCYVEVTGYDKPVYCFTADVLPVEEAAVVAA